jgi:hypothetical protein
MIQQDFSVKTVSQTRITICDQVLLMMRVMGSQASK